MSRGRLGTGRTPKSGEAALGQAMLLTVLIISGAILGATTIAGLLMVYQLRQATNVTYSTQALFAADTGLEWELFKLFRPEAAKNHPQPTLTNGPTYESGNDRSGEITFVKSVGCAGPKKICRAFQVLLTE